MAVCQKLLALPLATPYQSDMRALLAPNLPPTTVHCTCIPTLEPVQSTRPRPIPPQKTNTALPDLYLINPTCGKASPYTDNLPRLTAKMQARVRFSSKSLLLILYQIKRLSTARLSNYLAPMIFSLPTFTTWEIHAAWLSTPAADFQSFSSLTAHAKCLSLLTSTS